MVEENWEGVAERECGEHRTLGGRAWCFNCSEYCSPGMPCLGCERPSLEAERDLYKQQVEELLSAVKIWKNATESRCRLLSSRESSDTMLAPDRALIAAAKRIEGGK